MQALLDRLVGTDDAECSCSTSIEGRSLVVDARDCDGRLADAPACRETIARAAAGTSVRRLRVRTDGVDRCYDRSCLDLLAAAARFAELVSDVDERLAERTLGAPLEAAGDAAARAAPIDEIAAQTGFLDAARAAEEPFRPAIAPSSADARIATAPPPDARLRTARSLSTGATVRIYDVPGRGAATYHLDPVETDLDESQFQTLDAASEVLAARADEPLPASAVRSVDPDGPVRTLASVLRKHTRGFGVLEDYFADPAVTDVYASGPATDTPLWVVADGEPLRTNVTFLDDGVAAIASKLRRSSGRSFSRASPTIDATAAIADQRVRVSGVLDPATAGHAFAFRAGGREAFTLPALVANGTVTPAAAGLLSIAVRRSAAGLVAGTRGAGKTTLLGALLWELAPTARTIVIEDTPELPVGTLQEHGRDVQPLHTTLADGPGVSPTEALRTALRLGESALVLGEVRGEEAAVLYEAMRVGASGEAVLGTIHGDGAEDVRERVVGDLGVQASSFASTDVVITCERSAPAAGQPTGGASADADSTTASPSSGPTATQAPAESTTASPSSDSTATSAPAGSMAGPSRRVASIEEVRSGGSEIEIVPLFEVGPDGLVPTGTIDRGNSHLVDALTAPDESYADVRERIRCRGEFVGALAARGTTAPDAVTTAYARNGDGPW